MSPHLAIIGLFLILVGHAHCACARKGAGCVTRQNQTIASPDGYHYNDAAVGIVSIKKMPDGVDCNVYFTTKV